MAIYHFSGQIMSRISKDTGKPKSPLACAAYRSGDKLVDEIDNQSFYYKRDIKPVTHILTPSNAPEWTSDRQRLWNEVNKIEKNYNAQFAREFNVALPIELTNEQQEKLTLEFCKEAFVDRGMVADIAIHRDDENNPHFHVMLTVRPFNPDGSWGVKARREYKFDEYGEHVLDKRGKKSFYKVDTTDWNKKETFNEWRKMWAEKVNVCLKENGINESVSHLSNEDRGIEYLPTIHEGYVARKMEKKGIESERVSLNKKIKAYNKNISDLSKFKERKKRIEKEQKFVRRFSPKEKQQLSYIAKEMKFFINYKTVTERKEQLKSWKRSIQFTTNNDYKVKQLSRIDKEEELLKAADEILSNESERFINKYYPNWDIESLTFDEKLLIVEETISAKRVLTEEELDQMEEKSIQLKFEYEIEQIYANPYAFAMTLDHRISSIMIEKERIEKILKVSADSSQVKLKKAAMEHPMEFKKLRKLIKDMDHIFEAKDLINELYDLQINNLYPNININKLSIQEKDFLLSGAEYYEQPITKETIKHLKRYTVDEQIGILDILSQKHLDVNQNNILLKKYNLNIDNPHHLIFFKDECLRSVSEYPIPENYIKLIKEIDPVTEAINKADYESIINIDENINKELNECKNSSLNLLGVTHGMLYGLLQDRSYSSKKQFEEDLKTKSKKKKKYRSNGPSL
ncbi:MobQ family relaxase [Pontibacillus litoralis]|uniref:MobA/MobL protein domain-containing protein n=1 Tax=Pontibacillus litoralis JSM 072002 TaxID=1385512 RepID=A0A0A5HNI7_9BACI|nr:MobQ family relaxase [Pontibacillus litoralis]KGX85207.1 hypothetical protein N784_09935 [Pontibacillus litoralis JSM 072002]